jgi:hypothetical protein
MKQYKDTNYYVTEDGFIYRKNKSGTNFRKNKLEISHGYYRLSSFINGKKGHIRVHRMVAELYIPNPDNKPIVNHIDGDKLNNHYTNLEWVTHKENKDHAVKNGLYLRGEEHTNILTEKQVIWIRKNYVKGDKELGSRPLSRKFNVSKGCIDGIIHYRTWKHIDLKPQ